LRYLYSLVLYVLLPWVVLRLYWRGARVAGYREHWRERLGFVSADGVDELVWIHAVSVGEVRAAQPLVRALQKKCAPSQLLLTTTTPSGRQTISQLFGGSVQCAYLPWDLPGAVQRFLDRVRPRAVIIMETELWPNLYHALAARKIPFAVVNARLSKNSLRGYRKFPGLTRETIRFAHCIAAQSADDADRLRSLGARDGWLEVTGNLKFDVQLPTDYSSRLASLQGRLGDGRRLWVAGSTHPGEDEPVLRAHLRVLQEIPDCLLVIAPRHPERAPDVAAMCRRLELRYSLFSESTVAAASAQVVILDTLGDLAFAYGLAEVAFIGGSLVESGGHNPVEAAVAGSAIVTGPHLENFKGVYQALESAGAVMCVTTAAELEAGIIVLLSGVERRQALAGAGPGVVEEHRGALGRTLALLESAGVITVRDAL